MLGNITWVLLALVVFVFPWLLKLVIPHKVTVTEAVAASVLSVVCAFVFFHTGKYVDTVDYEVYSGEIVGKDRDHSSYQQRYDCNCDKEGRCQSCYRTIYTVTWTAISNIGRFQIDYEESRSSSVYNRGNPARYSRIYLGEPVAVEKRFTNYVKAVPNSIFNTADVPTEYDQYIPKYPKIYDFYYMDRVIPVMTKQINDLGKWNAVIREKQKEWGYKYKANVIIVFTDLPQQFALALKSKWIQGKQNDLVLVIGLGEDKEINWVDTFGWSENESIKTTVKNEVLGLRTLDSYHGVVNILDEEIKKGYKYRDMEKDFSYLKEVIEPPMWVVILTYLVCLGLAMLMAFIELEKELAVLAANFRRRF